MMLQMGVVAGGRYGALLDLDHRDKHLVPEHLLSLAEDRGVEQLRELGT